MSKKPVSARNRNAVGAKTAKLICMYPPAQITCRNAWSGKNRQKYRIANKRAPWGRVNRNRRSPAQQGAIPRDQISPHAGNLRGAEMGRDAGSHGIRA